MLSGGTNQGPSTRNVRLLPLPKIAAIANPANPFFTAKTPSGTSTTVSSSSILGLDLERNNSGPELIFLKGRVFSVEFCSGCRVN